MIVRHLDEPKRYAGLRLMGDDWELVFQKAIEYREQPPEDGEYLLRGHEVRAIVKTVQTKERSEGVFEVHRRDVDIHLCLDGSEVIEFAPGHTLHPRGEYDDEHDCTLFDTPESTDRIEMRPGRLAVIFPGDGHMPGLTLAHPSTRKVVFKVPYVEMQ